LISAIAYRMMRRDAMDWLLWNPWPTCQNSVAKLMLSGIAWLLSLP